jgi:hypothetical protein
MAPDLHVWIHRLFRRSTTSCWEKCKLCQRGTVKCLPSASSIYSCSSAPPVTATKLLLLRQQYFCRYGNTSILSHSVLLLTYNWVFLGSLISLSIAARSRGYSPCGRRSSGLSWRCDRLLSVCTLVLRSSQHVFVCCWHASEASSLCMHGVVTVLVDTRWLLHFPCP